MKWRQKERQWGSRRYTCSVRHFRRLHTFFNLIRKFYCLHLPIESRYYSLAICVVALRGKGKSTLLGLYRSMLSLFRLKPVSLERCPSIAAAPEGWKLVQSVIDSLLRLDKEATAATVELSASLQVEFLRACCVKPNHFVSGNRSVSECIALRMRWGHGIRTTLMKLWQGREGPGKGWGAWSCLVPQLPV